MRALHHRLFGLRTQARLLRARAAWRNPALVRPAGLVLRLDPCGLPGWTAGDDGLTLPALQDRVAETVRWRGPLPVTVLTERLAEDERVSEVARFAHRLECPATVRAHVAGLPDAAALRVVDAGVDKVVLVLDGDLAALRCAVDALLTARADRRSSVDVVLEIPWTVDNAPLAEVAAEWGRKRGLARISVTAPVCRTGCAPDAEAGIAKVRAAAGLADATPLRLAAALNRYDAPDRPGAPRKEGRCPVGGQRLEIDGVGELRCCPFKEPLPQTEGLAASWAGAGRHLAAIAACDRACSHPELQPVQEA